MPHWPLSCGQRSLWGPTTRQRPCLLWAASLRASGARAWRNTLRVDCCDSSSWKQFLDTVGTSEHMNETSIVTWLGHWKGTYQLFASTWDFWWIFSLCQCKTENREGKCQSAWVKSRRALTMPPQQRALFPQHKNHQGFILSSDHFHNSNPPLLKLRCCASCWKKWFGAVKSLWFRSVTVEGV